MTRRCHRHRHRSDLHGLPRRSDFHGLMKNLIEDFLEDQTKVKHQLMKIIIFFAQ